MSTRSKYIIPFQGLSMGEHVFVFDENDVFFANSEQNLIKNGQFKLIFKLRKSEIMLQGQFDIKGTIGLVCDRSLEEFEEQIEANEKHIWKLGSTREELNDEIEVIPFDDPSIQIDHLVFDYIALALPLRKLHPRFRNEENENNTDEGTLVYSTDKETLSASQTVEQEPPIDPRWAALAKLKNKL